MERLNALRGHLGQYLFPDSRAPESSFSKGQAALTIVALLVLGTVLQLARIGWTGSLDALWAEDGAVFLPQALTESFGHAVSSEYSGYLVLIPRLIAEAASALPLRAAPATISTLSALLVTLSGVVVWRASSGHIASPWLRGALALATVLTPVGGLETIDSASYVSWTMLVATFWLLLWRPRTETGAVLAALFVLATALSNPGVWFFIPLALLRALAPGRDRRDWTILTGFCAGAAIQVFALAFTSYEAIEPLWSADIWTVLLQRVVVGTAFGVRLGGGAWAELGWPFLVATTALAIGLLALGLRRVPPGARYLAAIAVPTAIGMFVVSVYQRAVGTPMLWPEGSHNAAAGRYAIVPVMLLLGVALALIDSSQRRREPGGAGRWLPIAAVALILVSVAVAFPVGNTAVRGTPTWGSAVDAAAASCAESDAVEPLLPVSPPGFGLRLPCSAIPAESP